MLGERVAFHCIDVWPSLAWLEELRKRVWKYAELAREHEKWDWEVLALELGWEQTCYVQTFDAVMSFLRVFCTLLLLL